MNIASPSNILNDSESISQFFLSKDGSFPRVDQVKKIRSQKHLQASNRWTEQTAEALNQETPREGNRLEKAKNILKNRQLGNLAP